MTIDTIAANPPALSSMPFVPPLKGGPGGALFEEWAGAPVGETPNCEGLERS